MFRFALRPFVVAVAFAVSLAGCARPVSIDGERLDPAASRIAATVALQRGSIRAWSSDRTVRDADLATAWYVEPGRATWVTGPVRITRLTWYGDGARCLGCPRTFDLEYRTVQMTDGAPSGRPARRLIEATERTTVFGAFGTTPDDAGHQLPVRLDADPVFETDGRLAVTPARFAQILHDGLAGAADVPPVPGVGEFDDPYTASCPQHAALARDRAALRHALFSESGLRTPPAATAREAANAASSLSRAYAACARSAGGTRVAAWSALWSDDAALFAGAQMPRGRDAAAVAAWRRDIRGGDLRRARIRRSVRSADPGVAAYAAWVAARRNVHYGIAAPFLAASPGAVRL